MKFTAADIRSCYEDSLKEARCKLASLAVAENREPKSATGLNGWVFEQTIRYCLLQELQAVGLHSEMNEQVSLDGRAKIDLLVGNAAIEIKVRGSFGVSDQKYAGYRQAVEDRGWVYLYLTMQETHPPYREATKSAFGPDHAFFLDSEGDDWTRFVRVVTSLLKRRSHRAV